VVESVLMGQNEVKDAVGGMRGLARGQRVTTTVVVYAFESNMLRRSKARASLIKYLVFLSQD
jgi:hypothetical protein